jgi:methyl-accepting chemotaxis protein
VFFEYHGMVHIRLSLVTKLFLLAVIVTLLAGAGLWWLNRSAHADEVAMAASAAEVNRDIITAATDQSDRLIVQAQASSDLVNGVRELQLQFQLQVLAFKNLIVRGERPDQKDLFVAQFEQHQQAVAAAVVGLRSQLGEDAQATARLLTFSESHAKLTAAYRNAWGVIDLAETWAEGMHRADDYMVGRDAEPIHLLDELTRDLLGAAARRLVEQQHTGVAALNAAKLAGENELQQAIAAIDQRNRRIGTIALAVLVVGAGLLVIVGWRKVLPIRNAASALDRLASGDLEARLQVVSGDEIGRLAQSFNRSIEALAATLGTTRVDWTSFAAGRRDAAVRLGGDLVRTAAVLGQAGGTGAEAATAVDAHTRQLAGQVRAIGSELDSTAAGVEELTASLSTVAANAQRADAAVAKSAGLAEAAGTSLGEFNAAAARVSEIVELIATITRQVNLLALNATIESARAGEHGRGFTVVANEVKALAHRTAEATSDITSRVETMRSIGDRTEHEVQAIQGLMREAASLVREVTDAVEQQATTTRDMSQAISRAAGDGRALQSVADELAAIAARSAASAATTREASAGLERLTTDLRQVMGAT